MKTAEEIYHDLHEEFTKGSPRSKVNKKCKTFHSLILYAMKLYAEQALDLAAEKATFKEIPFDHMPLGFKQKVIDKDSILSLKDQLK